MSNTIHFDLKKILTWNKWHISIMLFASIYSLAVHDLILISVTAILSFSFYLYLFRSPLTKYSPSLGYANIVTLIRAIILFFSMLFWDELNSNTLFFAFLIITCLDWLDGFIAKKMSIASEFGLYLDMETDSLLVATMSFILWQLYGFHWIILVAGFLRYPYAIVVILINGGTKKEPKKAYASIVAGIFFVVLLLNFLLISTIGETLLYISSVLILASFLRSFLFQLSGN
ncbi:MAG: phosphatidylglycerophosphate synthase [Sediminicola sp.]|jgi:phosphatidylglycerophosphate synthase